jgi:hypothetical protein
MKYQNQGKKDYVVVIKNDDGTKKVFSKPVTEKTAVSLVINSKLPLDYVAIRHIEELGIKANLPFKNNAPYNPEFLGAQPARAGQDY